MQTVPFGDIAFEDREKSAKIMLFLDKVGEHPKDKIHVEFTDESIIVEVKEFNGVNYRFNRSTFGKIVPSKSSYTVSSGRINIIVQKEEVKPWSTFEKQKEVKLPDYDKNSDAQANLMNMMKDMYNNGDDDMKRTIAKAWTEQQDKNLNGEKK